ncbi:hypothetical protein SALBM311S_03287 [Streptomyces alboniger]
MAQAAGAATTLRWLMLVTLVAVLLVGPPLILLYRLDTRGILQPLGEADLRQTAAGRDREPVTGAGAGQGQPIVLVLGVTGSGKRAVGEAVAGLLHLPFVEGDDYHPAANVAKISAGRALDDADREPWLRASPTASVTPSRPARGWWWPVGPQARPTATGCVRPRADGCGACTWPWTGTPHGTACPGAPVSSCPPSWSTRG